MRSIYQREILVQVNWLNTDMFYLDFRIYRTDFKGPVPPVQLHVNFSAYYGNLIRTSPKPGDFRGTLFTINGLRACFKRDCQS